MDVNTPAFMVCVAVPAGEFRGRGRASLRCREGPGCTWFRQLVSHSEKKE